MRQSELHSLIRGGCSCSSRRAAAADALHVPSDTGANLVINFSRQNNYLLGIPLATAAATVYVERLRVGQQEAQLSQRDRAMLRVIEYFAN